MKVINMKKYQETREDRELLRQMGIVLVKQGVIKNLSQFMRRGEEELING